MQCAPHFVCNLGLSPIYPLDTSDLLVRARLGGPRDLLAVANPIVALRVVGHDLDEGPALRKSFQLKALAIDIRGHSRWIAANDHVEEVIESVGSDDADGVASFEEHADARRVLGPRSNAFFKGRERKDRLTKMVLKPVVDGSLVDQLPLELWNGLLQHTLQPLLMAGRTVHWIEEDDIDIGCVRLELEPVKMIPDQTANRSGTDTPRLETEISDCAQCSHEPGGLRDKLDELRSVQTGCGGGHGRFEV